MNNPFNTKICAFKSLFGTTEQPYQLTLNEIYSIIKKGNDELITKINKIRSLPDGDEKKRIKESLFSIMFNGLFSARNDASLTEHSGLCVIDFDKYENEDKLQEELQRIKQDKYTTMAFRSPSGNGIKVIIRIPKSDKDEHKRRFKAYKRYINSDYFDDHNGNVSRVCFESYDPDIYFNQYADEFQEITAEEGKSIFEDSAIIPVTDEDEIITKIVNYWNDNFGYQKGQRNNNLYILACFFAEYGISRGRCESFVLSSFPNDNDFSEQEILSCIRSAYNRAQFASKRFEDKSKLNKLRAKLKEGKNQKQIAEELNINESLVDEIKKEYDDSATFWTIEVNKKGYEKIIIDPFAYAHFIMKQGFRKFYPEKSESPIFVRIIENKVRLSSTVQIKDTVLDYLIKHGHINVWNHVSSVTLMFNEGFLNMIDSIELKMLRDDKNTTYIPFRNGVLEIKSNSFELKPYIYIEGYVWENQIIQRDFKYVNDFDNDFQDMINKVSNESQQRKEALEHTIGYLLHSYKDKTDQKAIIINDQEIDDNPNGGSGKSLLITAISNFKKVVKIDGKAFDPSKSDFVYQRVNIDTQILAFDDVKRNFNFEQLFSLITEGITVNRKNKDEIFIPFDRSPKIIITTNYVINGAGTSHDRRRHEIEFYQYFNNKRTPLTTYGRLLFDSWNESDWSKFDSYMVNCIKKFLTNGLISSVSINADAKRFIQSTSKDFYDYCMEGNIILNQRIYNTEFFNKYTQEYKSFKDFSTKHLLKYVSYYADYMGLFMSKGKDMSGRYFILSESEQSTEVLTEEMPF